MSPETLRMKYHLIVLMGLVLVFSFVSCSDKQGPTDSEDAVKDITDYSKPEHWVYLPESNTKQVDVFYLYPTAWQRTDTTQSIICSIDNSMMLAGAKLAFARQATAFQNSANIYAPYYRQIDPFARFMMASADAERIVAGIPTTDAEAAFDYYIKHYNNGRPFILAGHSQGSNILANLLSGYLKNNPQVYSRMIAAYVIGYSITNDYLAQNPHLKFAAGPDDIGVIISYNTQAPDVVKGTNIVLIPGGIAINPISWKRDETLAPASENLGSITLNSNGTIADGLETPVMNYADAKVDLDQGVIICSTLNADQLAPARPPLLVRGIYHSYDFTLYYYNLKQNAANRINKFLNR